jgi:multisubunit Na+/H+ antiporter MnhG subunit
MQSFSSQTMNANEFLKFFNMRVFAPFALHALQRRFYRQNYEDLGIGRWKLKF